jgi:hypothetical protein
VPLLCRFLSNYDSSPAGMQVPWTTPRRMYHPDVTRARRYRIDFVGQVDNRSGYQERWALFHAKNKLPNDGSSIIFTQSQPDQAGPGVPSCPAVPNTELETRAAELHYCHRPGLFPGIVQNLRAHTRYSLFLRGDDEGSDRLVNALSALQIPLVVGARPGATLSSLAWLPFPTLVNWSSLVVHVNRERFMADPAAALEDAMRRHDADEEAEDERQRATVRANPDFLWSVLGSRVHENVLTEANRHAARCRVELSALALSHPRLLE